MKLLQTIVDLLVIFSIFTIVVNTEYYHSMEFYFNPTGQTEVEFSIEILTYFYIACVYLFISGFVYGFIKELTKSLR